MIFGISYPYIGGSWGGGGGGGGGGSDLPPPHDRITRGIVVYINCHQNTLDGIFGTLV